MPDKRVISPGETVHIRLDLHNPTTQHIHISNIETGIPWFKKPLSMQPKLTIPPNQRMTLVAFNLQIPNYAVGQQKIRFYLHTWQYDSLLKKWLPPNWLPSEPPMEIWTVCHPRYRAFVSRSNRDYDRPVVEPIVTMIQQWGFETITMGINIFEEEPDKISQDILAEIIKADCLIGIATPRDLSALDGFWKTFTWLHSETTMAFTMEKPILVIADKGIRIEGLIAQKYPPKVFFSQFDLPRLYSDLCYMMPSFRNWIKDKKRTEFYRALQKVIAGVAIGAFIFGAGYATGKEQS